MLVERVEGKWIKAFAETVRLCGVTEGQTAAVLWESRSGEIYVSPIPFYSIPVAQVLGDYKAAR